MAKPKPTERVAKMVFSRDEAAKALNVSTTTIDRIIKSGKLRAKRLEGRVIIPVSEIERYIAGLEDVEKPPADEAGGQGNVEPIRPRGAAPVPGDHNNSPSRA